jgi:hypothetical protein
MPGQHSTTEPYLCPVTEVLSKVTWADCHRKNYSACVEDRLRDQVGGHCGK